MYGVSTGIDTKTSGEREPKVDPHTHGHVINTEQWGERVSIGDFETIGSSQWENKMGPVIMCSNTNGVQTSGGSGTRN